MKELKLPFLLYFLRLIVLSVAFSPLFSEVAPFHRLPFLLYFLRYIYINIAFSPLFSEVCFSWTGLFSSIF